MGGSKGMGKSAQCPPLEGVLLPKLYVDVPAGLRAVASLTVPGGQEFHFPHFFLKFQSIFLIFPQTLLIFFLILALRVGDSPTREGPGYATGRTWKIRLSIYQLHPILLKLGAFYHNLLKTHPIYVILTPSSQMKTHRSLYQISQNSTPKGRHMYLYYVNVRCPRAHPFHSTPFHTAKHKFSAIGNFYATLAVGPSFEKSLNQLH